MQSQAGRVQIKALRMFLLLSTLIALNYINITLQGFTYVYTVVWHQYQTQNYKVHMIPCAREKKREKTLQKFGRYALFKNSNIHINQFHFP